MITSNDLYLSSFIYLPTLIKIHSILYHYFAGNKKPRESEADLKYCQRQLLNYLARRFLIDKTIRAIAKIMMVEGSGT